MIDVEVDGVHRPTADHRYDSSIEVDRRLWGEDRGAPPGLT
jgi:hypothetical protein